MCIRDSPYNAGTEHVRFHRPGRHCLHQARSVFGRGIHSRGGRVYFQVAEGASSMQPTGVACKGSEGIRMQDVWEVETYLSTNRSWLRGGKHILSKSTLVKIQIHRARPFAAALHDPLLSPGPSLLAYRFRYVFSAGCRYESHGWPFQVC